MEPSTRVTQPVVCEDVHLFVIQTIPFFHEKDDRGTICSHFLLKANAGNKNQPKMEEDLVFRFEMG